MVKNGSIIASVRRPAVLALVGLGLLIAAPGAEAQWFNLGFGLRPDQVEREIVASGYQLAGPVERNGGVYLADVVGRGGDRQRLVVDANSGRLLQRFRARRALASPSRYLLVGDEPIPRPPGLVEGRYGAEPTFGAGAPARRAPQQEVARGEDPSLPIVNVAPPSADMVEKPKHKAVIVKRRKTDPAPVEQPVSLPPPAASAPAAEAPAAPAIVAAPAPPAAPAAPVVRVDSAPPVVAAPPEPRVAQSKPAAPAAEAAPAKPAKPRKPVLNDLPVDPLE
jgi:hypothetical protein